MLKYVKLKNNMERKIGDVFVHGGNKLKVCKSAESCIGCFFFSRNCFNNYTGCCSKIFRNDKTDIIFKEVTNEKS